jgi:photosystem II stability/assembly factor-like uncharacterized protein
LIAPESGAPVGEMARADKALVAPVEVREPAKQAAATMADVAPAAERERDKREAMPGVTQPAPAGPPASRMAAAQEAAAPAMARPEAALPSANAAVAADAASKGAGTGARAMVVRTAEAVAVNVAAPGGAARWRVGANGRVERSDDAGATWQPQASGVTTDLLAGSAPSHDVCWIVGAAGTVLLTTDGERWKRLPFPLAVDLTAVAASSSSAAVVTARDGRRFETLDAGFTWTPKQ